MAKSKSTKTNALKIAVIPGDGIGNEVVPEGIRVLEAVGSRFDIACDWKHFDWSC
jgi:tartrate dehydrogenase/decarboxylase/D-malate dehydrogenase